MNTLVERHKLTAAQRLASRFGVDATELANTLKATAFKQKDGQAASDAQMMALMIVADQYGLNPFTKEIYAYPDKQSGIVPVVSVDGWARIINEHDALDGIEFRYSEEIDNPKDGKPCPIWCEVIISRKDRSKPIVVREYLDEVYRDKIVAKSKFKEGETYEVGTPWQSHTKRMLRHKTLIQGSRIAFGFAGIYDEDEAERILERDVTAEGETLGRTKQIAGPRSKSATVEPKAEATQTPDTARTGAEVSSSPAAPSTAASAPQQNGTDKPSTDGMRKTVGNKLKGLAAVRGEDLDALTKRLLHALKADSIDGLTFKQVNAGLDWIENESQRQPGED